MSNKPAGYYEATKYLGMIAGNKEKDLQETACCDPEIREVLAIIKSVLPLMDGSLKLEAMKPVEILKTVIVPMIKRMGYALWERDTVTDMALLIGEEEEVEDAGQYPPETPEST